MLKKKLKKKLKKDISHQSSAEINIYIKPTGEIIVYGWNTKLDEIVQETDLIHPGFKLIKGNKIYCG